MNQGSVPLDTKADKVFDLSCGIHIELFGPRIRENGQVSYDGGSLVSKGLHDEVDRNALDRIEQADFDEDEAAVNAIEALVLAHAMEGIDVTTPVYECGVETAIEAIGNNVC